MNKTIATYALSGLLALSSCTGKQMVTDLIPLPDEIRPGKGFYEVDSSDFFNFPEKYVDAEMDSSLAWAGKEGYEIKVGRRSVKVRAATDAGLFYGMQTLRQLVTGDGIPCCSIKDTPRFVYRGIHIDVARHFFPKEEIMKIMKEMALYKLNKLHLHLTDNGGWRIQIDKYPELTEYGSFRTQSEWVEWWDKMDRRYLPEGSEGAYGGYFSKDDIRAIVSCADSLHIEVIPEIEFPAHSDAVFAAFPELCCEGRTYTSGEFCAGNMDVYTFFENVLKEVMDLFPSKYINIGGDEARKISWKTCPKCQALMKQENMASVEELQHYMVRRIEDFIEANGRKMVGWDEILDGKISDDALVLSYRGQHTLINAARQSRNVVFTPGAALYFDWYQANPDTQPRAMVGFSPIKKTYSMFPVPCDSIQGRHNTEMIDGAPLDGKADWLKTDAEKSMVIGVQGCAWSEFMDDSGHLEYMLFPRMLAVAEMGWTDQEKRQWPDFKRRVNIHIPELKARGINTFTLSDEVYITASFSDKPGEILVSLDCEKFPVRIHYTLDGTDPDAGSPEYTSPFPVSSPVTVKAAVCIDGGTVGPVAEKSVDPACETVERYVYVEPEHWKNF